MNEEKICPLLLINKPVLLAKCLGDRCRWYVRGAEIAQGASRVSTPSDCALAFLAVTQEKEYINGER